MARRRLRWSPRKFAIKWDEAKARAKAEGARLQTRNLSEPCEVTPDTIYNWRRGVGSPSGDQMFALAWVLGCDVEDFGE